MASMDDDLYQDPNYLRHAEELASEDEQWSRLNHIETLESDNARLRERVAVLESALRPFEEAWRAALSTGLWPTLHLEFARHQLTPDHFEAAVQAIQQDVESW